MTQVKHLTRLSDLTIEEIMTILETANQYAEGGNVPQLTGKVVANLFFEPSTRTQYSFCLLYTSGYLFKLLQSFRKRGIF